MTHQEAIAVKIYHQAIESAYENNVNLMYSVEESKRFYRESALSIKKYSYIMDFMYFDDTEDSALLKATYIDLISDYLTKLEEVHTGIVSVR